MPVLTTLVALHVLGETNQNSLVDPRSMRRQARRELADSPALARTLEVINNLEGLANDYEAAAEKALAAYKTKTSEWDSSKEDLLEILDPLVQQRRDALVSLVGAREELRALLSESEWEALFS